MPTTEIAGSTALSASYAAARYGPKAGAEAFVPSASNCGRQNAGWFGSLPMTNCLTCGRSTREHADVRSEHRLEKRALPRSRAADTGRRRARREGRPSIAARDRPVEELLVLDRRRASLGTKRTPMTVCRSPSSRHVAVQRRAAVVGSNLPESSFAPTSAAARGRRSGEERHGEHRLPTARIRIQSTDHGLPYCPPAAREPRVGEERVKQPPAPEADGIVGGEAGFASATRNRGLRASSSGDAPCSGRSHATFGPAPAGARCARAARRAPRAVGSGAPDSPRSRSSPAHVAEDERCGAEPCMSPSVTPEYSGMHERALSLDEEQLAAARRSLDHEPLGGAGEEVGRPPRRRRCPSRRSRSRSDRSERTPTRVRDDAPRGRARRRPSSSRSRSPSRRSGRCARRPRGWRRSARSGPPVVLRRSRSSTPCTRGELRELGVVGDELVKPALDVEALP